MGIIRLNGLEFFAYHGVHAEERQIGNRYRVDVELKVDFSAAGESDHIAATIDYSQVFELVKARMAQPARLLEHLASQMASQLRERYPQLQAVRVEVSKFNPPIAGMCESASATVIWPE